MNQNFFSNNQDNKIPRFHRQTYHSYKRTQLVLFLPHLIYHMIHPKHIGLIKLNAVNATGSSLPPLHQVLTGTAAVGLDVVQYKFVVAVR